METRSNSGAFWKEGIQMPRDLGEGEREELEEWKKEEDPP